MTLKKKDFIEIEFTAKVKGGTIFDSNIKEDIDNPELKAKAKPFVFCLGEGMFLQGVEDFLIGKEIGEHNIELTSNKAFGLRNADLIQMMPMRIFKEQDISPIPGIVFNFDGRLGKILTVTGGRVMVDFNNPIAGKDVEYKIKVLRKVEDMKEKVKALIDFLFNRELKFEIKNSENKSQVSSANDLGSKRDKKLIIHVEKPMKQFVEMFKDKFKEILGLELEVKEKS